MQTAWRSIRRAWPTRIGAAAILWAGLFAAPASAVPPTITSVTVTSYSTDNDHSIALPQTRIPELTVHGTNLFPAVGAGPLVVLRRAGYPDKYFPIALNVRGGDNTNGWVTIRNVDLAGYEPGSFDIVIDQAQPLGGEDVAVKANAFELRVQGPEQLIRRSAWGGPINKTQPVGNKIYLGSGCRFVVLDATNEMNPVELGSIDLQSTVLDFQIAGNYAYVCTNARRDTGGPTGFCAIDISNPASPQLTWSSRTLRGITAPAGEVASWLDCEQIWLRDSYAYVTSSSAGLYVFDLQNPSAPRFMGSILTGPFGNHRPIDFIHHRSFEIVGSYIYAWSNAPNSPAFMRIYHLGAGIAPPTFVNQIQLTASATDVSDQPLAIASSGSLLAYFTAGLSDGRVPHLTVWDISNPVVPVQQFKIPLARLVRSIAFGDGIIMAAEHEGDETAEYPDFSRGLLIYDIETIPTSPALVANLKTHGSVYGVKAVGTRAYIADHGEGLIIVNCSQPSNPQRMGGFFSPSSIRDVARNGDLAYVSDQWNGFTVLNLTEPTQPTVVGKYQIDHSTRSDLQGNWGIAYYNGRVYLAVGDGARVGEAGHPQAGIDVIDVTNPAQPTLIQAFDPADCIAARGLEVDGSTLRAGMTVPVAGCGSEPTAQLWNLQILSDGTIVETSSKTSLMATANTLTTINGFTYTEGGIIDNRGPLPVTVSLDTSKYGMAVGNNHLYRSGGYLRAGLHVRGVQDPVNPGPSVPWALPATDVTVTALAHSGTHRLWMTASLVPLVGPGIHLYLFDTTDPLAPRLLAANQTLVGVWRPRDQGAEIDNGPAGLIKVEGSFVFAAERVGHISTSPEGPMVTHGLVIAEHVVPTTCPADFNQQGGVTVQDIFDFLFAWFGLDPAADVNATGGVTLQDLLDFLAHWFAGC